MQPVPHRRSSALPGLPVTAVPAAAVEPGEVVFSPDLPVPVRVWWRWSELDGSSTLLLPGTSQGAPRTVTLQMNEWVLSVGRGRVLDSDEQVERLLSALRGGLWLTQLHHPQAPDRSDLRALLDAYSRRAWLTPREAAARARDGLPRPPHPTQP